MLARKKKDRWQGKRRQVGQMRRAAQGLRKAFAAPSSKKVLLQAMHRPEMYEVTVGEGALGLELEVYDVPCPEMTVSAVLRGGPLEGRVRVGDILVRIGSTEVQHLTLEAVQRLCWRLRRRSKRLTFVHAHA